MPKLTGFPKLPLPGPPPVPVLGHLPRVIGFFLDPIGAARRLREYGDVVAAARDNPALVCAFGPERNREVLTNPSSFPHDDQFIRGAEGTSLGKLSKVIININGDLHKRHRRLMMPAFGKAALDRYAEDIVRFAERELESWPVDEVAQLDVLTRNLAVVVALQILFGLDTRSNAAGLAKLAVDLVEVLTHPLTILLPYAIPGTPYARTQKVGDRVIAELGRLVAEKRSASAQGSDALSLLIRATDDDGGSLDDDELIAETLTLFVAGHETTAKTLTWTLFLLERHPEVLAGVLEELDGVVGERSPTADDLGDMPLLERVVKESMRLLPAVPTLFLRVPTGDTRLGDHVLPKGANVVLCPFITHHDPAIYPEPHRFDPSRWEHIRPTPFEYLPFGAGSRMCIGAAMAMLMTRLLLITILQRRRIAVVENADISRLTRSNIMMAKHGVPVQLQRSHRRRLPVAAIRGDIGELVELD